MSITSVICPSASDAARVLASNNRARFFGGGTLLMRSINEGDQSFDTIVRINDPIMMQIQNAGRQLIIGAGVTMSGLLSNRDAQFLASAARSVGGPAIRNMATVGGNLFAPSPYGDFTTALIALDGIATLADGSTVPLADFLLKRKNDHTSIVTQISVNRPNSADEFHFLKVSRVKPKGIAVMTFAACLPRQGGRLQNVRVAAGAMAPTPVRMVSVEQALEGQGLDAGTIEAAVGVVSHDLAAPTDAIATSWYRAEVAPVHLRRLLIGASGHTGGY